MRSFIRAITRRNSATSTAGAEGELEPDTVETGWGRYSRGCSDTGGSSARTGENPPCLHTYGNVCISIYTGAGALVDAVSRCFVPGKRDWFLPPSWDVRVRPVATCPSRPRFLPFPSALVEWTDLVLPPSIPLNTGTTLNSFGRVCVTDVYVPCKPSTRPYTPTRLSRINVAALPVIMCVHTSPCTYVLLTGC